MKIIDKYILKQYSIPLFYCFATFFMIFIIFDLFENLSSFIASGTDLPMVIKYYAYALPSMLVFIAPISLLLGVLYCIYQLARHNELTALRASGVSLYRIVTPFLVVGFLFSLLVAVVQESIVPDAGYWAYQFIGRQKGEDDPLFARYEYNLPYKNEIGNRIWAIEKFDRELYDMHGVTLRQCREDGSDISNIRAEMAKWLDGTWWFFDVTIREFDTANMPRGPVRRVSRMEMSELNETPRDFEIVTKKVEFKSSFELWRYLVSHPQLSHKTYSRIAVDMHGRLAMPWMCFVVMLFGIPSGVFTGRKGALVGIILALVAFFGFNVLMNFCSWMGKVQLLTPVISAWLPNLTFLLIGLVWMKKLA